jgi:hypothetical protein
MSSIIHAESPQNFWAKAISGWCLLRGISLKPSRASRVRASMVARPNSRLELSVTSISAAERVIALLPCYL